jgi:hypothetical protein
MSIHGSGRFFCFCDYEELLRGLAWNLLRACEKSLVLTTASKARSKV